MIPNEEVLRHQVITRMLTELNDAVGRDDDRFTPWENDFVVSVSQQYSIKKSLSVRQSEILERIYDKL